MSFSLGLNKCRLLVVVCWIPLLKSYCFKNLNGYSDLSVEEGIVMVGGELWRVIVWVVIVEVCVEVLNDGLCGVELVAVLEIERLLSAG